MWDPNEEYWGEDGEPIEDWAKPIIACGPRPMFEMEQVLPGCDPDDFDSDPVLLANALRERGKHAQARGRTTSAAWRLAGSHSVWVSKAYCLGGSSTIDRSCAACRATGCAYGARNCAARSMPASDELVNDRER